MYQQTARSNKPDMLKDQQALVRDTDAQTIEEKRRIMTWLKNMSASYLAEIAWETGLSEYQARNILNLLWRDGLVEPIVVSFERPDLRLLSRVADQSAQGQGGYQNFSRKHWFSISEAGRSYLGA